MNLVQMSASIGAMIVHVAADAGADVGELLAATGFDPALAQDPDARIDIALETALWQHAARLCGDEAFGLHAAFKLRPGAFDVLEYAVRTAPTLGGALARLSRYNGLVHDAAVFSLIEQGDLLRIEHAFRSGASAQHRHSAEFTVASLRAIGEQLTGRPVKPRAVEFRHGRPAPAVVDEHRCVFGVEPSFARPCNAFVIDRALLDVPLPAADPSLSRIIERHAEALLASRPSPADLVADRVKKALSSSLGDGVTTLSGVAERLRMSERTLQRKLADEGVTFDALLDDLRRDLALRYLADPRIAIAEVAYLLGYSEPSPFHRAFKRWTGQTPSEARRRAA